MMKRASSGFSLIEVLVAFVILALTLSVVMRIFSGGLRNVALADEYSRAVLLAESRLAELGAQPLEGAARGEFDGKYRWSSTVHPWADDAGAPGLGPQPLPVRLMVIEVRVAWGEEGGKPREIGLSTLHLASVPAPGL
jgi:general secretion pathway protein I